MRSTQRFSTALFARSCALLAAVSLAASSAAAQTIAAGSDLMTTPPGSSSEDQFNSVAGGTPIPANFFGPGSDPFDGTVNLHGRPLDGTPVAGPFATGLPGQPDTIVRRLAPVALSPTACPTAGTVPIEIVALNLQSVQPITVTFGGGVVTTMWEVRICLSSTAIQPTGNMQIFKDSPDGGRFFSFLPVISRITFTRCRGTAGVSPAVIDPAPIVGLSGNGSWSFNAAGLALPASPGGVVDHDCVVGSPPVPYPATSNFHVGASHVPGSCATPNPIAHKELTPEQEMLAKHGVMPNCPPPGQGYCFGDGSNIFCPCSPVPVPHGAPGNGCPNSQNPQGARLYGVGEARVSADTLVLRCEGMINAAAMIFYQGTGAARLVFGDGHRCVGGMQRRFPIRNAFCGKTHLGAPVGDVPISISGAIPPAGGSRFYQGWYRDPFAFCTIDTFNLSNGYQVLWLP